MTAQLGEQAWDALLDRAQVDGAYTSLGNYPDEEFSALLGALRARTGKTAHEALAWFGRLSMHIMAERYPAFFEGHDRLRPFLLSVDDVIHCEVRKLYPGANVPTFEFDRDSDAGDDSALTMHYRSSRRLCHLAEGFIHGAADVFAEDVRVSHLRCMLDGDDECALQCRFEAP